MKICDYLYDEYEIPDWLEPLLFSPVVQRLRGVALSNIPSLTYPMIAGVTRFAHSIGVCILADKLCRYLGINEDDRRQLMCSALLHDAGMPPLGHLTEETLSDLGAKFDHEASLRLVVLAEGRRFLAMPDGHKIGVTEAFVKASVDGQKVFSAIKGGGKYGSLIASNIDLDNIDNVVRLYRLIFPGDQGYDPVSLACAYFGDEKNELDSAFRLWGDVRVRLYNKLMFSIEDFAQKATVKRLIKEYFNSCSEIKPITEVIDSIRFMTDFQFQCKILSAV